MKYLLDHLVAEDFHVVLADFGRMTRMNRDNDGDLIYLSRIPVADPLSKRTDCRVEWAMQRALVSQESGLATAILA